MIRRLSGVIALAAIVVGCTQKPKPKPNADTGAAQAGKTTATATTTAPQPTSMDDWERFDYSAHAVAQGSLESLPLVEVQRIRGIIFGRHGRVFQDSTLQAWLATRSWYRADTTFTNARLTAGERENLEVVRAAEAKKHTQIEPGDMRFYQDRVITTAMLGDHSPQDWEVLEAEVLANHGYVFATDDESESEGKNRMLATDDLQHYFGERYWYKADTGYKAAELSGVEKQNLDTIALAVMRRNKRSVSPGLMNLFQSTRLTEPMLANVSINDLRLLRNEVYARHGRPFQTPWLAEYFRSEPWYTPRQNFQRRRAFGDGAREHRDHHETRGGAPSVAGDATPHGRGRARFDSRRRAAVAERDLRPPRAALSGSQAAALLRELRVVQA